MSPEWHKSHPGAVVAAHAYEIAESWHGHEQAPSRIER